MKSMITVFVFGLTLGSVLAQGKKPEVRIGDLEHRIHDLVNDQRQRNGLGALQLDQKLSAVARAHSEDMAKSGYFDHSDRAGRSAFQRVALAGIVCHIIGENLFQNNLYTRPRIENGCCPASTGLS